MLLTLTTAITIVVIHNILITNFTFQVITFASIINKSLNFISFVGFTTINLYFHPITFMNLILDFYFPRAISIRLFFIPLNIIIIIIILNFEFNFVNFMLPLIFILLNFIIFIVINPFNAIIPIQL